MMRIVVCVFASFTFTSIADAQPTVKASLPQVETPTDSSVPGNLEFNRDIRPILSDKCFKCHGPDAKHREAKLRLDDAASAMADRDDKAAIAPGDLEKSLVWHRITSDDDDLRMPPASENKAFTPQELALVKRWIQLGAKFQGHWSFVPPVRRELPQGMGTSDPIDAFIAARLDREGFKLSPEADRTVLIRRLHFDLIGLPPTPTEVDAFVGDHSPKAYEELVDRLLASRHYGERMTLNWLDVARYGDSSVYHADGPRDMWAWRDWVIDAFNANMPYDQFTVEQLAGDLLPNATVSQKVATGFNRNHGTTDEGGAIDEEYRVEYVVDRVNTTSTVWLGLTMQCCQCHEHKYDPITQEEFYGFYAFFNQSSDRGMQTRKGNAAPMVSVPKAGSQQRIAALQADVGQIEARQQSHVGTIAAAFDAWLQKMQAASAEQVELLPADMLAHFPLDESDGNLVQEAVNDRTGKLHGKPKWTTGKLGGCVELDGNSYVDAGDVGNFERTNAFSYGGWIYTEGKSNGAPIARMDDGGGHRGYDLYCNSGRVAMHLINHWPDNAIKVNTKQEVLKPKQWQHVFVTYDGSSKAAGVRIYVDGKPHEWTIEQDRLSATTLTDKPLYIGRRNPGSPFKGQVDDVRLYDRALAEAEVAALAGADPISPLLAIPPGERTAEQTELLRNHYLHNHDKQYQQFSQQIARIKAEIGEWSKPLTTVMMMDQMDKPRPTYLLMRGNYASPDKSKTIEPGVPAFLPPLVDGTPRNRLGMAQWLVDGRNPLTARVTVNRYWQMFFGTGIVETTEDFGSQGSWPSHPDLLDWLAVDFVERGWDVKSLVKQIVMSQTYRQSSKVTPELYQRDPDNRLLARGPRFRLQGEFIRDNALAVSGLLVSTIGGPSVKPYQPAGLWREVSLSGATFKQDTGESNYRRSMYTYYKRSAPVPNMLIFDAPTREKCVVRRQLTNTPLQALVTMNDPQFVETARALGQRLMKEGGGTPEERIRFGYRLATARHASDSTVSLLGETYKAELARFQAAPEQAEALLKVGNIPRDTQLDAAEHAAWTVVSSMLLNLDATLTKS